MLMGYSWLHDFSRDDDAGWQTLPCSTQKITQANVFTVDGGRY